MSDDLQVEARGPRPSMLNVPGAPNVTLRDNPRRGPGVVERVAPTGEAVTVYWLTKGTRSVHDPKQLRPVKGQAA
jgi:hypothetical protein